MSNPYPDGFDIGRAFPEHDNDEPPDGLLSEPTPVDEELEAAKAKVLAKYPKAATHVDPSGRIAVWTNDPPNDRPVGPKTSYSFRGAWLVAAQALDHRAGLTGIEALEAEMRDRLANKDKAIAQLQAQLQQVTAERDEARHQAVWAAWAREDLDEDEGPWAAMCPGGLTLSFDTTGSGQAVWNDGEDALRFQTPAEALEAGRSVPWWEVKP